MIGTITLNPCIDQTLIIEGFTYGGMNRVQKKRLDVSGKGVNVSIVLTQIGKPVRTIGLNYEDGGDNFVRGLKKLGIHYESVTVPGALRENNKVYDLQTGVTTELNQKGEFVNGEQLKQFTGYFEYLLEELDIVVITGSVPEGVSAAYYCELIKKANAKGVKCILDAEGELMLEGMKAKPYLIKPNLYEFENAFGLVKRDIKDILVICQKIIAQGIEVVCLSMGGEGAIIASKEEAFMARPTIKEVKSTQGAGDSLVAGICIAMEEGASLSDMLRYGVATAQGSLIWEGTQLCKKEDFEYFKNKIHIEKI